MDYDLAVSIRRPPEAVWAFLDDVQDHIGEPGSPVPEMEKIPPGPVRVGTRWREVVRLLPGMRMTIWTVATEVDPGRRLAEVWRGPWMTGRIVYDIEPTEDGSVLHQRETMSPEGPLALMSGRMDRMFRPRITARLDSIRDQLEAG